MDHGWLDTPHGKVAIGWLVFEDLLTVAILVLLPVVAGPGAGDGWATAGHRRRQGRCCFVVLMMYVGDRARAGGARRASSTRGRASCSCSWR